MKISIVGTGYVGLVSGACLADLGHAVTCIDIDKNKIERLEKGEIPIYEPGLNILVKENVQKKRLRFAKDYASIKDSQVIFIAVGTPTSRRGDGYADLSYVYEAARMIAKNIKNYTVVVDKSTVPVGTARQVARIIKEENPKVDFDVASNPEFLREGDAISDFMRPNRIVIGTDTKKAREVMREVYEPLYISETPFVFTNPESAEVTKYASNAFLATKISFINEVANLCEEIGANVQDVARGVGLDERIGKKFLHAGPGYGGSCFPKDTKAYMRTCQENGVSSRIVESVVEVNASQKARMVKKITQALDGEVAGKTIAVLGLAFKPETDDMREAPSITILSALFEKGAKIRATDPQAISEAKKNLPEIQYFDDPYETVKEADVVVLITEWNEYRALDLFRIKKLLKSPVFVDLRNVYDSKQMKSAGLEYYSVGRG